MEQSQQAIVKYMQSKPIVANDPLKPDDKTINATQTMTTNYTKSISTILVAWNIKGTRQAVSTIEYAKEYGTNNTIVKKANFMYISKLEKEVANTMITSVNPTRINNFGFNSSKYEETTPTASEIQSRKTPLFDPPLLENTVLSKELFISIIKDCCKSDLSPNSTTRFIHNNRLQPQIKINMNKNKNPNSSFSIM